MIEVIWLLQLLRHKNPGNENVTENKNSKMSQHLVDAKKTNP